MTQISPIGAILFVKDGKACIWVRPKGRRQKDMCKALSDLTSAGVVAVPLYSTKDEFRHYHQRKVTTNGNQSWEMNRLGFQVYNLVDSLP